MSTPDPPPIPDDITSTDFESQETTLKHPPSSYKTFAHRSTAFLLQNAASTGVLGTGRREPDPSEHSLLTGVVATIPWSMLFIQLIWSGAITGFAYALADRNAGLSTLSVEFWATKLSLSPSVAYGVGWALFVLLGFFIREASARHREALICWETITDYLQRAVRQIVQAYPEGTWHDGDRDRLIAHLVAYPIALKMTLRGEREADQLSAILHEADIRDVLDADYMHIHCMRVVRAYLTCSEDDQPYGFPIAAKATPAGWGTRYFVMDIIDNVDIAANSAVRIAQFRPSAGYINHLRIFLYIWLLFLPLALVQTSGWFTALFAILITYTIGMLFTIAHALNMPYGFDLQDIKLNRISADAAGQVLRTYSCASLSLTSLIKADHETPAWLEQPRTPKASSQNKPQPRFPALACLRKYLTTAFHFFSHLARRLASPKIFIPLGAFTAWIAFVVLLTWGLDRRTDPATRDPTCRWWCTYIPVSTGTTAFVSLGIFLLLGFWMNDAYTRYWKGLQIWQTNIRTSVEELVFQLAIVAKRGLWHQRDRERIFSHLVALPYATKLHLRDSRDVSELEGVLAPQDLAALADADNLPAHCFSVLYAYCNSVDSVHRETLASAKNPFGASRYSVIYTLFKIENAVLECVETRKIPISPSFTTHLQIFTAFWLALLPLSMVVHDGFFSFLYLIPIGYSIINLLVMGVELSDPFGHDENDIPLDMLCDEMKDSIHEMYENTIEGRKAFIHPGEYSRDSFKPKPRKHRSEAEKTHYINPTIVGTLKKLFLAFPSVSIVAQVAVTLWAAASVAISYGLSFTWSEAKRENCRYWCSPIDVDGSVLENIGFALFMILALRASDALGRYEEGAEMIYDMEMHLRILAVEMCQAISDGTFHANDKERIVAHIAQIPLCFRDKLLNIVRSTPEEKEGLLSDDDRVSFEKRELPIEYLLRSIEAYILVMDLEDEEEKSETMLKSTSVAETLRYQVLSRVSTVRAIIARAYGIKRFPVVISYTNHQRLFMGLWLILLPLGMAPATGWLTILWAPIISYGVFGLESLSTQLVDPYGEDQMDIPVDELCTRASNTVLEAVHEIDWDCTTLTKPSELEAEPRLGTELRGREVYHEYTVAHFENFDASAMKFGEGVALEFQTPSEPMLKHTLYAHIVNSVPWWVLLGITVWTTIAVIISYVTRTDNTEVRWWESKISINISVGTYVSFAAFMLLGFYVQAAFRRYHSAGSVWGDNLRAACHALAAQFQTLFPAGSWHEGDHNRILAHIAAVPVALKLELRGSRDVRELKGLLSPQDLGKVECADIMTSHIVDVIRSYFYMGACHKEMLTRPTFSGNRFSFVKFDICALERAIRSCLFLRDYAISPAFISLLNALMGIWFFLLPFVLAEISGWFTILWVPIIAYGLLGMYAIAAELAQPFGTDLNDLNLDKIGHSIVADVLFVQKHHKKGIQALASGTEPHPLWKSVRQPHREIIGKRKKGLLPRLREMFRLARNAVGPFTLAAAVAWAAICVGVSYVVGRHWKIPEAVECAPWWCSRIAVAGAVKEYVGFALFLLLGFWVYDSHGRYVSALRIWEDGVIGFTRLLTNRIFESYGAGTWHEGDLERIAGHVAAFSIVTKAKLRDEDCREQLGKVVCDEDARRILSTEESGDYCIDVVRAYMIEGDRFRVERKNENPCGINIHWQIIWYLNCLRDTALECERMVRIPMPYGYVQHLKIFLFLWLALLPLGLVESTGWVTILWVVFIAYGVLGIQTWAEELSDPFGYDISDVPLDSLCDNVLRVVGNNLKIYEEGTSGFVYPGREAFPVPREKHIDNSF